MSLVVARKTPRMVRIVSDLRVTRPGDIRRGFMSGALKAIIVAPALCVAYAGAVGVALAGVRRAASRADDSNFVLGTLQECKGADFIVATPHSLCAIKEGMVRRDLDNAWVGDEDAFSVYQSGYHGQKDTRWMLASL